VKKKLALLIVLPLIQLVEVCAQGCSDAGFCSVDGMKHSEAPSNDSLSVDSVWFNNTLKTGISIGNTRYSVWIINPYLTYSRKLTNTLSAAVKLDGQFRTGQLTQVAGFSDLTLSLTQKIGKSLGVIAGGKIPLSDAGRTLNGLPMPMAYQTSLGTYDAILGAQYLYKSWFVALGWQQPLVHNSNTYIAGNFSNEELGATYPETNNFKRAGDVLVRLSYYHNFEGKKFSFTYSVLPIYHLKNDEFKDANNNWVAIEESKGLTLNTHLLANYKINPKTAIEFSTGIPVIARNVRPEGLSQFAITCELIKKF
jgi:hypothetical protein